MEDRYKYYEYKEVMESVGFSKSFIQANEIALKKLIEYSPELDPERFEKIVRSSYSKSWCNMATRAARRYVRWLKEGVIPQKQLENVVNPERPYCGRIAHTRVKIDIAITRRKLNWRKCSLRRIASISSGNNARFCGKFQRK